MSGAAGIERVERATKAATLQARRRRLGCTTSRGEPI